jgi:hypothetical protein
VVEPFQTFRAGALGGGSKRKNPGLTRLTPPAIKDEVLILPQRLKGMF